MPSRNGEQVSKLMGESQFSGISLAVHSEYANEASLSCFLSAVAWKACSLSVHMPYGIVLHFVQLGRKSHVRSESNDDVRAFAAKTLPIVQEHLQMARNVAKKVGAK